MAQDSTPRASDPVAARTADANALWAGLLVEELVRSGVERFFVAPGSRSTPLVAAIAANGRAKATVHYDERGSAFAALGSAKATGRPAAWVTTSGTAVANGLPAVVEASTDDVPMLLLTADRPPELRRTGANQTIDQPGIFGGYVRWAFDFPPPEPNTDPASVLTTVDQAVSQATRVPNGPVHLNLMFREPLITAPEKVISLRDTRLPEHLARWREGSTPYTVYPPSSPVADASSIEALRDGLAGEKRGIVVAGRIKDAAGGRAVVRLAEALGWPVLPDVGSQARLGVRSGNVVPNYDLLLSDEEFASEYAPRTVVHFGGGAVSGRLQQFIARSRPERYVVVGEGPDRLDPGHLVTLRIESGIERLCDSLVTSLAADRSSGPDGWTEGWRVASRRVEDAVEAAVSARDDLTEPFVARAISRRIPDGHGMVVASSMPVRDVDIYAVPDGNPVQVVVNRGASGIDGTIATAAGYTAGKGSPVTVLIGDLALLHDLNSLSMLRTLPVTVVVVNNDGGGIFSMLPISEHETFFEEYFGTPHGLGFEHAARMFGLDYASPRTPRDFEEAYDKAATSGGPTLIETNTDRELNSAFRRELVAGLPAFRP